MGIIKKPANSSSSATTLKNLTDTNITIPNDGDVLSFDGTSLKWVSKKLSQPTLPSLKLKDMTDINTPSPSNNDVLTYINGQWTNKPLPPSTGGEGGGGSLPSNAILFEDFVDSENVMSYVAPFLTATPVPAFLTTDNITISYRVNDSGIGGLVATYTIDSNPSTTGDVSSGENLWTVGTLTQGNHILTVSVTDDGGGVSNTLTFNIVVISSSYTGFVMNGLKMFLDHPSNNTTVSNPDNYFKGSQKFTISMTLIAPKNAYIMNRYVFQGSQNKFLIQRNSLNQFIGTFYATDTKTGVLASNTQVNSPTYTDEASYYHIVIVRNNPKLQMYVNNVKVGESISLQDNVAINETILPLTLGGNSFPVTFKNIAYYDRPLLPSELYQNYTVLDV